MSPCLSAPVRAWWRGGAALSLDARAALTDGDAKAALELVLAVVEEGAESQ